MSFYRCTYKQLLTWLKVSTRTVFCLHRLPPAAPPLTIRCRATFKEITRKDEPTKRTNRRHSKTKQHPSEHTDTHKCLSGIMFVGL